MDLSRVRWQNDHLDFDSADSVNSGQGISINTTYLENPARLLFITIERAVQNILQIKGDNLNSNTDSCSINVQNSNVMFSNDASFC